jgi:hypothetical protein
MDAHVECITAQRAFKQADSTACSAVKTSKVCDSRSQPLLRRGLTARAGQAAVRDGLFGFDLRTGAPRCFAACQEQYADNKH